MPKFYQMDWLNYGLFFFSMGLSVAVLVYYFLRPILKRKKGSKIQVRTPPKIPPVDSAQKATQVQIVKDAKGIR